MPPPELETPTGELPVAPAAGEAEAEAWARVEAAWADDEAHRAYLAANADLDGLARAGGRYRAVLAARPDDAIAQRWRDEVVRRATVQGLALLPRTAAPASPAVPRKLLVGACLVAGGGLAFAAWKLAAVLLDRPAP